MINENKAHQMKNVSILRKDNLTKLHKGTPVNILYASTPTTMIYFGKIFQRIDGEQIEYVQLIELPTPQQKYSMFSVYVVPLNSLFSESQARLYPSEQKLPRRVIKGDPEHTTIDDIVTEYDKAHDRIKPTIMELPREEDKKEKLIIRYGSHLNTGTESFSEYDAILKGLQKYK